MADNLVLMDHDGGVDDYLSTALLLTMEHLQVLGIVVTPADCYIGPAVGATRKLLDLLGRSDIPVAESTVRGLNPFPRLFRRDSFTIDHLPILNETETIRTPLAAETGQAFMVRVLHEAPEQVTILSTGPLSTIAAALEQDPSIEYKIKELIWMGGALNVPGNVDKIIEGGQDGSAEWNVYWDPPAAHRVWQTDIPITLCPLDITNNVPVTSEFVRTIARNRRFPLSDFAGQCYALVTHQDYFFWDVLTTAYLGRPDLFELRRWETAIIPAGPSMGRTVVQPGGKKIKALDSVKKQEFYEYILKAWAR
jgi:purine nucleosidase